MAKKLKREGGRGLGVDELLCIIIILLLLLLLFLLLFYNTGKFE